MIKLLMAAASMAFGTIGYANYRSTADIPAVTDFDAARYMGTWHEIARLSKWFEVSFFRPFYGEYRIIWLSPACDVAMVTSDDRSSLWILSKRERLPTDEFNDVVRLASRWGFDISALEIDN